MNDAFRKKPEGWKPSETYEFKLVHEPLLKIYNGITPLLDKESYEPPTLLFVNTLLKTNYQTYRVICRLLDDNERDKYPIQAHMLARTPLDAVFVLVALFDKPENTRKYELAGYRTLWEELEIEEAEYGNTPEAKIYLDEKEALIKHLQEFFKLSPQEVSNASKAIPYWPIPGQMLTSKSAIKLSPDVEMFLKEIYKWHYKQPSALSHFAWSGIAMSIFTSHPEQHWDPGKFESDAVYFTQMFLLIMLSEVEIHKKYGFHNDLRYLWTFLGAYYQEVNDYYLMRYDKLLDK